RLPAFAADEHDEVIVAEIVEGDDPYSTTSVIEVEPERTRSRIPGIASMLLALAAAVVTGVAVGVATNGDAALGAGLGFTAIGLSITAVLVGLVAVVARLGRAWGTIGVVV